MIKTENFEQVEVTSAAQWHAWLQAHCQQQDSIWLVTYKKHLGDRYIPHSTILDEMLCFGWIDGIARKLDEDRTMQLMSPRRTQIWAKTYKDRAARLIAEGRMHCAGLRAIEESKRLGLWDAMQDVDDLINPDDLIEALQAHPTAYTYFTECAPSYRRNVLRWIASAKTKKTRNKRLQTTAELSAKGEKVPHLA